MCKCDDVLLSELLKHIKNEAIEIRMYKNKLNVMIYDTFETNGCHNQTEFILKLNYCPVYGKKLNK
jgi:hypothetical protein